MRLILCKWVTYNVIMSEGRYFGIVLISNIKIQHMNRPINFERKYVLIVISKDTTEQNTSIEHK